MSIKILNGSRSTFYDLDTAYSNGNIVGRISWDQDNATAQVGLNTNVVLHMGQDDMWYVKNQTGASIPKGSVVYAAGTVGASGRILVAPYIANGTVAGRFILGIAAEAIADGADGYVIAKGKLRNFNTNSFTAGTVLWASPTTAGAMTSTEPSAPNIKAEIAFVVHQNTNGVLAVRRSSGTRLSDDSQVEITSPSTGQLLRYNSNRWENWSPNFLTAEADTLQTVTSRGSSTTTGATFGGNVGIGTTSPFNKLTVGSVPASGYGLITISADWASGSAISTGIKIGAAADTGGAGVDIKSHSNYAASSGTEMSFWTNSTGNVLSERMRITSAGNVGIGTTSPSAKLDINAASSSPIVRVAGGGDGSGGGKGNIRSSDQGGTNYWDFGRDNLTTGNFVITPPSGNSSLSITIGGNVGIGTTAPTTKLTVVDGGIEIRDGSSTGLLYKRSSTFDFSIENAGGNLNFFNYGADERLMILVRSSNRVSIGNNQLPSAKLEVQGQGNTSATSALNITNISNTSLFRVRDDAAAIFSGLAGTGTRMVVADANGLLSTQAVGSGTVTGTGTTNYISKFTSGSAIGDSQIFDNGTNVGIGTASPSSKLDVDGGIRLSNSSRVEGRTFPFTTNIGSGADATTTFLDAGSTNGFFSRIILAGGGATNPNTIQLLTASAERMRITAGGTLLVGGTGVPFEPAWLGTAVIGKDGYNKVIIGSLDNITVGAYVGGHNSAANAWADLNVAGASVIFRTEQVERMRLASNGNVGIGTSSPNRLLTVAGTTSGLIALNASSYRNTTIGSDSVGNFIVYDDTAGVYRMTITSTGNVGIGITTPTAPLDTNGVRIGRNFSVSNRATVRLDSNGTSNPADVLFGHTSAANQTSWDGVYWSLSSRASADGNKFYIYRGAGNPDGSGEEVIMALQPNGNVGIGTTTPSAKLHVVSSEATVVSLISSGSNARINVGHSGNGGFIGYSNTGSTGNLFYVTTGSGTIGSGFVMDNNGNFGIGTTAPAQKFHVQGSNLMATFRNSDTASNQYTQLEFLAGSRDAYIWLGNQNTTSWAGDGGLNIYTGTGNMDFWTAATQKVRITASGNMGIGTMSPSYKLSVVTGGSLGFSLNTGTATAGNPQIDIYDTGRAQETVISSTDGTTVGTYIASYTNHPLLFGTNAGSTPTAKMTITSAGNVGIGTSSPSGRLHVTGVTTFDDGLLVDGNTANGVGFGLRNANGHNWYLISTGTGNGGGANNLGFYNSNVGEYRVYFKSDGNVGIGTTTPKQKLIVEGTLATKPNGVDGYYSYLKSNWAQDNAFELGISDDGATVFHKLITSSDYYFGSTLQFWTSDTEKMRITSSGNVGIGTTSPSAKLHVVGNAAITGVTSTGNRKLSLGILDINVNTESQIRINTTIPFALSGADFTVNIKGFRYGSTQMVSLSVGWHYYLSSFFNETAISNGAWKPTISLAQDANGFVVIYLPAPSYWAKLYVESVYSNNYGDAYSSGWNWTDANLSNCTNIEVVPYQALATDISGTAGSETLATVTGRGATTASQVSFTKTDDNAISVGTIRGRAVGSQAGDFIHLYERVHIGSPNGWGAPDTAAPSFGLSVYGGANIGYGNNGGLTVSGTLSATADVRAPIFYDSADTSYYLDPNGNSILTTATFNTNGSSTISLTSAGTNAAMIKAGAGDELYIGGNNTWQMRFNSGNVLMDNGGYLQNDQSLRAPIFYDSNDTTYFLDPNSTTKSLNIAGNIDLIARSASWAEGIRVRVPNTSTWGGIRFTRDRGNDDGNWAIGFTGINASDDLTFWCNNAGDGGAMKLQMDKAGNSTFQTSVRSPQFRFTNSTNNAYFTGDSSWGARIQTDAGYIQFGPANSGHAHIYTDRPNFYFDKDILINGVQVVVNSGTWGINITGNSATVGGIAADRIVYGSAGLRQGVVQISDWNQTAFPNAVFLSSENSIPNAPTTDFTYGFQTSFHRGAPEYRTQFVTSLYGNNVYWLRQFRDSAAWSSWVQVIHSGNFNSYAPTLTGGGASGTWGINITGNAATITSQANSATITAAVAPTADTIVLRDGLGDVSAREFVLTAATIHTIAPSSIVGIYPTTNQAVKFGDTAVRAFLNVPTRTGGDASGTWGIDITGNAATATSVPWGNISGHRTLSRDDAGIQGSSGARSGFFEASAPVNYYSGASSWQHMIESRHTNDSNNYAMQIAGSFFDQNFWARKTNNSGTTAWTQLVTNNGGTWGISITGNAGSASSVAWTNVSGRPTALSAFTNDAGFVSNSLDSFSSVARVTSMVTLTAAEYSSLSPKLADTLYIVI